MDSDRAGTLGRVIVSLLGRSWRVKRLRPETGIRGDSVLYAFWHGVQLPLIYTHRNMGIRIMISRSRDGSLVSAVCEKMGFDPVRGSSSKGGTSAARELVEALRKGLPGAITPDGPRGPAEMVKKGVSLISRRGGVPAVPYGAAAFPAIRLRSWDRFLVPLPFAALCVSEGRPVPPDKCSPAVLTAAISQQQARAELAVNPVAVLLTTVIGIACVLLTPLARLVLSGRNPVERRERMGLVTERFDRPVWLHGASLGELKGLLPVVQKLKLADRPFHVTCTTPAGRNFLQEHDLPGSYLPLDAPWAVRRFLQRVSPAALILAETEFWPVLLGETVSRGIPSAIVNGRLSKKSLRGYRMIKPLFNGILRCFRIILTRSEKDTERFRNLGLSAETAGDGKTAAEPPSPRRDWSERISPGENGILVAGSTRKGEERIILEAAKSCGMTPVIVPRHDGRIEEIRRICIESGFTPSLWTDGEMDCHCVIVNVKGILAALYGLADAAFVGGTLVPVGGHNILEPLAHGVPVIVGPDHFHFTDLVESACRKGMCRVIHDAESGATALRELSGRKGTDCGELFESNFSDMVGKMLELLEVVDESK